MEIDKSAVQSVVQSVFDFIKVASAALESKTDAVNALSAKVATLTKQVQALGEENKKLMEVNKQASVKPVELNPSDVAPLMSKLSALGLVKQAAANANINSLCSDPKIAIGLLDELTDNYISLASTSGSQQGYAYKKSASAVNTAEQNYSSEAMRAKIARENAAREIQFQREEFFRS